MKFLKTVRDKKSTVLIKDLLLQRMTTTQKGRPITRVHASDLTREDYEYCPRQIALQIQQGIPPKKQFIPAALRYTFDEGNDKQSRLNNDWAGDIMHGYWDCLSCDHCSDFGARPATCTACGRKTFKFKEPRFTLKHSGASCGVDILLDVGEPKLMLAECKIIKSENFKKLQAPLSEHRVRTQLYLRMVAESDNAHRHKINTDKAHILYMSRSHGFKDDNGVISPFKEFIVQRDDKVTRQPLSKARALQISRESTDGAVFEEANPMYPARICNDMMCTRAGSCPVAKVCFSEKYSSDITWVDSEGQPAHTGLQVLASDTLVKEDEYASETTP